MATDARLFARPFDPRIDEYDEISAFLIGTYKHYSAGRIVANADFLKMARRVRRRGFTRAAEFLEELGGKVR